MIKKIFFLIFTFCLDKIEFSYFNLFIIVSIAYNSDLFESLNLDLSSDNLISISRNFDNKLKIVLV